MVSLPWPLTVFMFSLSLHHHCIGRGKAVSSRRWTLVFFKPQCLFLYKTRRHSSFLRIDDGKTCSTKDSIDLLNMFSGEDAGSLVLSSSPCPGFSLLRDHKLLCFTEPPTLQDLAFWFNSSTLFRINSSSDCELLQMFYVPNIFSAPYRGACSAFYYQEYNPLMMQKSKWGLLEVNRDTFLHACVALVARGVGGNAEESACQIFVPPFLKAENPWNEYI